MLRVMVFVDPATGELRGPEPGEQQMLVSAGRARVAAASAPVPVNLPGGGVALPADPARMDFLTATKTSDGSITYGHFRAAGKGGRHAQ
jgi:hypothetical protein